MTKHIIHKSGNRIRYAPILKIVHFAQTVCFCDRFSRYLCVLLNQNCTYFYLGSCYICYRQALLQGDPDRRAVLFSDKSCCSFSFNLVFKSVRLLRKKLLKSHHSTHVIRKTGYSISHSYTYQFTILLYQLFLSCFSWCSLLQLLYLYVVCFAVIQLSMRLNTLNYQHEYHI